MLEHVEWLEPLVDRERNPELERYARRTNGVVAPYTRYLSACPWILHADLEFDIGCAHLEELPDLVYMVVSRDNSCRFCFGAQRVFLRALGMSEERIARLEQEMLVADLSERDLAALSYARRLSRSQPIVAPGEIDALRRVGFSEDEIAEFSGHVALHLFFNRISTFAALPPSRMEEMPDLWWMRLLRPLIRPYFLRMRSEGETVALAPDARTGPYARTVNALDGLPMAGAWRTAIDAAMGATALSPRAAPLAFAVVARALGCEASEQEAVGLLEARGMSRARAHSVLDTLSGEGIDELDHAVAIFARETVWYVPARIQRRCRALAEKLSREQLLELIGITSIANSVCRVGAIAQPDV